MSSFEANVIAGASKADQKRELRRAFNGVFEDEYQQSCDTSSSDWIGSAYTDDMVFFLKRDTIVMINSLGESHVLALPAELDNRMRAIDAGFDAVTLDTRLAIACDGDPNGHPMLYIYNVSFNGNVVLDGTVMASDMFDNNLSDDSTDKAYCVQFGFGADIVAIGSNDGVDILSRGSVNPLWATSGGLAIQSQSDVYGVVFEGSKIVYVFKSGSNAIVQTYNQSNDQYGSAMTVGAAGALGDNTLNVMKRRRVDVLTPIYCKLRPNRLVILEPLTHTNQYTLILPGSAIFSGLCWAYANNVLYYCDGGNFVKELVIGANGGWMKQSPDRLPSYDQMVVNVQNTEKLVVNVDTSLSQHESHYVAELYYNNIIYDGDRVTTGSTFNIPVAPSLQSKPLMVVVRQEIYRKWEPNTYYSLGTRILPTSAKDYRKAFYCQTSGASGTSEPDWDTVQLFATINDGNTTWKHFSPLVQPDVNFPEIVENPNQGPPGGMN